MQYEMNGGGDESLIEEVGDSRRHLHLVLRVVGVAEER